MPPLTFRAGKSLFAKLPMNEIEQHRPDYEHSDADPLLLSVMAAGLVLFLLVTPFMLGALYRSAVNERGIGRVELPPTPRLQVDPPGELAALRQSENAALSSYAWVDRSRGFVRIPIDRALALTTERGLPGWRRP